MQVVGKLNDRCSEKFTEEQQHLQPLPNYRFPDYDELSVRVSSYSTIAVRCILYTVPSRLIGQKLTVHLYHDRLVGYIGKQQVVELPRIRVPKGGKGRRARCINYRHVIEGLRRKPRAFLYCTWQSELLPNDHWRELWRQLGDQFDPDSTAKLMVEALYIAATQDKEAAVADYLHAQLSLGTLTLAALQKHFQLLGDTVVPTLNVQQHPLSSYDQLLCHPVTSDHPESLSESEPASQATAPVSHAPALGNARTQGNAGTVVLRAVLACIMRIGIAQTVSSPTQKSTQRGSTSPGKKFYQL
jgi:hypothetical protein